MKPFCKLALCAVAAASLLSVAPAQRAKNISLQKLGTYATGVFDEGSAEIAAHDPLTQRLFVVNASDSSIDVIDITNPLFPTKIFAIDVTPYGDQANSVAVKNGVVAAAIQANVKTDNGKAVFFDANGVFLNEVTVGALPDMLTFTPNGQKVLVANEGEPNDDYSIDPLGTISIVDLTQGVANASVQTLDFSAYNGATLDPSIRIYGPNATVAQDLEPEYIATSHDSRTAWVTLQENNAIAEIDVKSGKIVSLKGLGFKNYSVGANRLDPSDRDAGINIANWPVYGMYQPDSITALRWQGQTFLITANEGDAREYSTFEEEVRVKNLGLDPTAFPNAAFLQLDENIGRLNVTNALGDFDNDNDFDALFTLGGRSFSIWKPDATQIFDSGDALEQITAARYPTFFNASNTDNALDSRSDNKGPEPEAVTVAKMWGRDYLFIGLERIGGIVIYDVSNPYQPRFVDYVNNRDFTEDPETGTPGDLGPEGILVISADDSPTGEPLLVTANEISGTTTLFAIRR